jgi:mono/diheme cytochrome c family protein
MKGSEFTTPRFQKGLGLALIAIAMCLLCSSLVAGADVKPGKAAAPSKKAQKKPQKKLRGAELYAIHCNRCHPERYATERTEAQWKTILLHMRTRANLPAEQAREIEKYLQEDSGK